MVLHRYKLLVAAYCLFSGNVSTLTAAHAPIIFTDCGLWISPAGMSFLDPNRVVLRLLYL